MTCALLVISSRSRRNVRPIRLARNGWISWSEMIRAVSSEGPQVITRHGEDVAVVVDIAEYRRLTRPQLDLASVLLGGPKLDSGVVDVFDEIEADRKADLGRAVDFEADA
jgi:prevent-host-death family protein